MASFDLVQVRAFSKQEFWGMKFIFFFVLKTHSLVSDQSPTPSVRHQSADEYDIPPSVLVEYELELSYRSLSEV